MAGGIERLAAHIIERDYGMAAWAAGSTSNAPLGSSREIFATVEGYVTNPTIKSAMWPPRAVTHLPLRITLVKPIPFAAAAVKTSHA